MMASLSPAVHASRAGTFIDPQRQAEYPILLGDSLQDTSGLKNQFFNVQYNWKPKSLSSKQKTVITKANTQSSGDIAYQLTIQEPGGVSKPYKYAGNVKKDPAQTGSTTSSSQDQTTSLALVFNQEKSAFILEKISAALDFNLTSAPGQSRTDVQAHPQLLSSRKAKEFLAPVHKPTVGPSDDDDEPDTANPYDYRHFLEEAKANAEKGLGSRTPIPGGLSGMSSPVPGASRFRVDSGPGTPLHKPVTSAPSAQIKKRKISDEDHSISSQAPARSSAGTATKHIATTKPKPKPTPSTSSGRPKPLSKERISDSDEEIGDTITLSRPSTANSRPKKPAAASAAGAKAGYAPSARIEVDEAADLVIDMGSPPPASRRHLGASPFAIARSLPPKGVTLHGTSMLDSEDEEEDAEGEPDDDVLDLDIRMRDVDNTSNLEDGDVEDLVLGSPRASTTRAPSVGMSRVDVDEDEDDELAAELEAALENDIDDDEDGDGDGEGVGLGISTAGTGGGGEDESEVSEEE
jgi:hypothetical protein